MCFGAFVSLNIGGTPLPHYWYLPRLKVDSHWYLGANCCDMDQSDTIGKIELIPSFVLSSNNTNYKNDIQ